MFKREVVFKIFILITAFAPRVSMAQYTLSGTVTDEKTGESLYGASLYISDLKVGATTSVEGEYTFDELKSGRYLVEVSTLGYKTVLQYIQVNRDTIVNFKLIPAVTELNKVVVTGVSRSTELKRNPIIVKTLGGRALRQVNSTNLIDGLTDLPGINQITTGPSISKPVIRGLSFNRIITLNNGIRQEGQQWGDEHGIEMDEYAVDRVEIIKGPGSLIYGSDGIGGVLNFLPPKILPSGKSKTQVLTEYQSNNNLLGYSLSNAGNVKGFQWLGRFSNKYAGNYRNAYDGRVYNSGFKEIDGSLFTGISRAWGYSHLTLSSFNIKPGIVEGTRDSAGRFTYVNSDGKVMTAGNEDLRSYKIGYPYQDIHHLNVALNTYLRLNHGEIKWDLGFQNNQRKEYEDPTDPEDIELSLALNTFTYNLRYTHEMINGWETSVGIGGMQQGNRNKGEEYLIPDYSSFDIGGFLFTQKAFKKFMVAGGLRYDNRFIRTKALYLNDKNEPVPGSDAEAVLKFASLEKNYHDFSGSFGLTYQIDEISSLKFNLSRGFRAPNIGEIASNGHHEGTFRYEIGNADLNPENSNQIDIAYYLDSEHITFELTPFVNFIGNYIYVEKLLGADGGDSFPTPEKLVPAFKFTAGNASLYGGEIYLDIHPHPWDWLHIAQSFSIVQAQQRGQSDSTRYLPFIPAAKYRGEIKMNFKSVGKVFSNLYLKAAIDYYFKQNRVYSAYGTERANPAYSLLSVGVGTDIKALGRSDALSLFLTADNLMNVAYQDHLNRLKYAPINEVTGRIGVYNMGRNISVKLLFQL